MVYVMLANGFEEMEALCTVDILRRADIKTQTVGVGGNVITGAHGIEVRSDIELDKAELFELEAVVLPGGMPGTNHLNSSEGVRKVVKFAYENNKYVCAICAAPIILGDMGLLKERNAVVFPGFEDRLTGAKVLNRSVVVDGKIITAKGPGFAMEFALRIVEELKGREKAKAVAEAMQINA